MVNVSRDQVRNALESESDQPIDRAFEEQLYRYCIRQSLWEHKQVKEVAS